MQGGVISGNALSIRILSQFWSPRPSDDSAGGAVMQSVSDHQQLLNNRNILEAVPTEREINGTG